MSMKRSLRLISLLLVGIALWVSIPTSFAAGETWQVLSVDSLGCDDGDFGMTVEFANFGSGAYFAHTVVTVGGQIYMNELVDVTGYSGTGSWYVYDLFNYGPVSNPGTYPIPAGQEMQIDLLLEQPLGTVIAAWRLVVDGCDTGNILFNGPVSIASDGCGLTIPDGSVVGEAPLGAQVYYEPGSTAPEVVLNPGTYIVTGQDESETYYQVVLACQLVWVRKDTMQPSFQAPQNGAPLPTRIVS